MNFTEEKKIQLEHVNNKLKLNKDNIKNIVFIYCPPKVGSTSLVSSIRLYAIELYTVIHIHDEVMLEVLGGVKNITVNELILYNKYIGKQVFVIDVYRSPIERKMSFFFENLCNYHFNNSEEEVCNYSIQRIIDRFNMLFLHLSNEDYFIEKYGIIPEGLEGLEGPDPINSFVFDTTKKYLLIEKNGIKYIKLRLCDSKDWGNILTSLLNVRVCILNDYNTESKKIGDLYKKFKIIYRIPCFFLDCIKTDKFLKLYYNNSEYLNYINTWEKKCDKNSTVKGLTEEEYNLYNNICLGNRPTQNILLSHYADCGCVCESCMKKRIKSRKGLYKTQIIHEEREPIIYRKVKPQPISVTPSLSSSLSPSKRIFSNKIKMFTFKS